MKSVKLGQMRTRITIKKLTESVDSDGFPVETWTDVFGAQCWCCWQNAHGQEVFDNLRLDLKEVATITMRYSPLVDVRCRVFYGSDTTPWEIISIDNVMDKNRFMEMTVRRMVVA